MKLYTEEQVKKAIDYGGVDLLNSLSHRKDMFVNSLTPIELPNNEEIESKAESFSVGFPISPNAECGEAYRLGLNDGYFNGAKWVLEQIKN